MGSLVAGIGSVVLCVLGVILGPLAIILGVVARRREAGRGMALAGIVTGAVGLLFGLVSLAGLALFFLNDDGYSSGGHVSPVEVTDDAEDEEDDNLFDDAADAVWDWYAGGTQETPCYSFEGTTGWIANLPDAEIQQCYMEYELWVEYHLGDDGEPVVTQVGVGGVVAQVVIEPVGMAYSGQAFPDRDLQAAAQTLTDGYFVSNGLEVLAYTETTMDSFPAVRFEIDSGRSDFRVTYLVFAPHTYAASGSGTSDTFLITILSSYHSISDGDELEQRVLDSFTWK